ncbi:MAG: hypothetical protein HQ596_05230 [Candidatus Saganbacteria bacterium]|nr:hypothetical protein [Candidatus Saganbacteria bacterium]
MVIISKIPVAVHFHRAREGETYQSIANDYEVSPNMPNPEDSPEAGTIVVVDRRNSTLST